MENFVKDKNTLSQLVFNSTQIRKLEKLYIDEYGDYEVMKLASEAMFLEIKKDINLSSYILVFIGSGNNGGDGLVIAKRLIESGYKVLVMEVLEVKTPNAQMAKNEFLKQGGKIITLDEFFKAQTLAQFFDDFEITNNDSDVSIVALDAITGIGMPINADTTRESFKKMQKGVKTINYLKDALEDYYLFNESKELTVNLFDNLLKEKKHKINYEVISIDIPSLLSTDNGNPIEGLAVKATQTLTVFTYKLGLFIGEAKNFTGENKVVLNDLDYLSQKYDEIFNDENLPIYKVSYDTCKFLLPKRSKTSYKTTVGKLLLVGGHQGLTGAIIIASLGALYSGCGLIMAMPLSKEYSTINISAPEIMTADDSLIKEKILWANVGLIGPGLGRKEKSREIFECFINEFTQKENSKKIVIDADGLYHLQNSSYKFKDSNVIITPHLGEGAMLLGLKVQEVAQNQIKSALDIARKYNVICVLKSSTTIIASPNGFVFVAPVGVSGMSSGGMGDLLSGIIASTLAQGLKPLDAAVLGVIIHGKAGELSSQKYGNIGTHATSLLPEIRLLINGRME